MQRQGNLTVLFTNAISQQVGLSATEFECFSLLYEGGPLLAGQLADKCGLSTGGVTGLINRLEKAGFVKREHDPTDGRRVIVTALSNEATHQKVIALYRPISLAFNDLVKDYSEEDLRIITGFLDRGNAVIAQMLDEMQTASLEKGSS